MHKAPVLFGDRKQLGNFLRPAQTGGHVPGRRVCEICVGVVVEEVEADSETLRVSANIVEAQGGGCVAALAQVGPHERKRGRRRDGCLFGVRRHEQRLLSQHSGVMKVKPQQRSLGGGQLILAAAEAAFDLLQRVIAQAIDSPVQLPRPFVEREKEGGHAKGAGVVGPHQFRRFTVQILPGRGQMRGYVF